MNDAFGYRELYDRLREAGYHDREDKTSHLVPYIPWLKEKTAYQSVLDIGCGAGGSFERLGAEGQEVWGIDVSRVAVAKGQSLGRNVVEASATELPFSDRQFELVASADVMEHLHQDDVPRAAQEIIRVASRYIFMKIATKEDVGQPWKTIAGHPLHLTIQPLDWWKSHFAAAGSFIRSEEYAFCLELNQ